MLRGQKIDASPALTRTLSGSVSLARSAGKVADNAIPQLSEKIKPIKESGLAAKLWEFCSNMWAKKTTIIQAIVGFILVIQGSQFKNLILCSQFVRMFLLERTRGPFEVLWNSILNPAAKDEGEQQSNEGDEKTTEQKSKQALKREAAASAKKSGSVDHKENAKVAEQRLKHFVSDEVSEAVKQVCLSVCACALVVHGGLAQIFLVAHLLVGLILPTINLIIHFADHEDASLTDMILSAVTWFFCLSWTFCFPTVAFIIYTSALGVKFIADSNTLPAKIGGQEPDVIMALAGTGFGALWQLWSWAQGGGLAWYFSLLYLPAVTAEGFLSLTARFIGGC